MNKINGTIMQYFEWNMECNQNLWNKLSEKAKELSEIGITAIWTPPAYKGMAGKDDVGYGVYDLYDLGEFDQKGSIKTKYGSKNEYINCIKKLKENGINCYADIVLNHKMGADIDFTNEVVIEECYKWAKWYLEETKVDGFRLDAVKHINAQFYNNFITRIKENIKKDLFSVGEYWASDISKLHRYIEETEGQISLFDVPLHYNLYNASKDENYDLSNILNNTLVKDSPTLAVTFVDNHDTQPGQSLESFIEGWFKIPAYCIILLRNEGYPCIFYGDFYGIPHNSIEPIIELKKIIELRKERAYGTQTDYLDNPNFIGWTREGDDEHINSGLAVVISNAGDGEKRMFIGEKYAGKQFIDILKKCEEGVIIDNEGWGNFKVKEMSASIWILD